MTLIPIIAITMCFYTQSGVFNYHGSQQCYTYNLQTRQMNHSYLKMPPPEQLI